MIEGGMTDDGRKIYTVSELNREIKTVLEDAFPEIWLEGEISNFRLYSSGHMYFSLKDEESQASAVFFQAMNRWVKFRLEDGLKVLVRGRISAYTKRGEYQIVVNFIEPAGKGSLQLAFEQLKARLEREGLFDAVRKKAIPLLPQKIGIVTSPSGAAIRDILSIIDRRFANVEIVIYPVKVQGEEAGNEIVAAIEYLNAHRRDLEVLLVGRGGGAYEDLWAFNEEAVARAIAASNIPVISCVGHETDFTIADFVADLRAPTPSAAAELVVRNKADLTISLGHLRQHLAQHMKFLLARYENRLQHLVQSRALRNPVDLVKERIQELDELLEQLKISVRSATENKERHFGSLVDKLNLLSPLHILGQGYAICWKLPGEVIVKTAQQVTINDLMKIRLAKGEIIAKVEKRQ